MVIITAFQAEDDSSILLSRSLLIIDEIMKETSFKAGVIGGVFTFLALFATTSKHQLMSLLLLMEIIKSTECSMNLLTN